MAMGATHMFAVQLGMQPSRQIWLDRYRGDYPAMAQRMSANMSAGRAIGIFVSPLLASACDVWGRKPVMLFGLGVSVFNRMLVAARPDTASLTATTFLFPFAMGHALGSQTALADSYRGDAAAYGAAWSRLMLVRMRFPSGVLCRIGFFISNARVEAEVATCSATASIVTTSRSAETRCAAGGDMTSERNML